MIDFNLPPSVAEIRDRTTAFIHEAVIPAEQREVPGRIPADDIRAELQEAAKAAGVFAPHANSDLGGLGLDVRGQAVVFEAAGYSILGPQALNCAAPDEGNVHMLSVIATPEQRERYLRPLAAGDVRSCFALTEPARDVGQDPSMLNTTAVRVDGGWSIRGHKWFITGAEGASFAICMARTGDRVTTGEGATMFLVDAENPGYRVERIVDTMDRSFPGGHAEVFFEDCVVPDSAVLGQVGAGYACAQVRLAPARLTRCMRWLGLARRAHDIALDHANQREACSSLLADPGMVQVLIADNEIDIDASRSLIWRCAWMLDRGVECGREASIAKAFVAEAAYRVADRSLQICGRRGVSGDLPLARILAELRLSRFCDGPTETHKWAIARRALHARAKTAPAHVVQA